MKYKTIAECDAVVEARIKKELGLSLEQTQWSYEGFYGAALIQSQEQKKLPKKLQDQIRKEARASLYAKAKAMAVGAPFFDILEATQEK